MLISLVLAYVIGFFVCDILICYEIGMLPDNVEVPPLQYVLLIAMMWPVTMPLAAYVSWAEENRQAKL